MVWAYNRRLAIEPLYSFANADSRERTLNSRASTRTPASVFWTVPTMRPSALISRHRSKGTSSSEVASGILVYTSRGISANSRSKFRSSHSTRPMVRAASTVSASGGRPSPVGRAMKSGTAKRGAAPASVLLIVVLTSLGCWAVADAGGGGGAAGCCAEISTTAADAATAAAPIPVATSRAVRDIVGAVKNVQVILCIGS
jgi:hypothetical protein